MSFVRTTEKFGINRAKKFFPYQPVFSSLSQKQRQAFAAKYYRIIKAGCYHHRGNDSRRQGHKRIHTTRTGNPGYHLVKIPYYRYAVNMQRHYHKSPVRNGRYELRPDPVKRDTHAKNRRRSRYPAREHEQHIVVLATVDVGNARIEIHRQIQHKRRNGKQRNEPQYSPVSEIFQKTVPLCDRSRIKKRKGQ